ncbi:MAG: 3-deoxy-D-manno-octulosonic acid transferase [Flavobacteriaceae bacterium]|nr:3-deoxy-D-manno-octulosonic acid transferase [Flavobacteriaceae bacterium]
MYFLYNIAIYITGFLLKMIAIFNIKIGLFMRGRKETFSKLASAISKNDKTIWFHCASLGEFEQGRPIIEKIKSQFPNYKIVLTFFSPSGYEVRKNYALADVVTYLPLDTKNNAKKFLEIVHPTLVVIVKYEFWPNILYQLKKQDIETILVSGIFRENQSFFKPYGGWMRNSLKAFSHFFVQNQVSFNLLQKIDFKNVTLSGDTRFDRVFEITKQDNKLMFIEDFIQGKYTLVAGSTWPKDEQYLVNYINFHASENEKFIIAPHNVNEKTIDELKNAIQKPTTLYSDKIKSNAAQVFIVDTIGILTKIYSYADTAYIGGGLENGTHNVLEPATFGLPLIIGPNYKKFQEAIDLVKIKACKVISTNDALNTHLSKLFEDKNYRIEKGKLSKNYISNHTGATEIILNYIENKL